MNEQELDCMSSLFRGATHEQKRDLIDVMPSKNLHKYYCRHLIPRQTGGMRVIYEPNEILKKVQRRINRAVLEKIPVSDYAFAYVSGRNVVDNARPHVKMPILLKLDIHHFFDNIHFISVYKIFEDMGYSMEFSRLLAGLTTIDDFLPQGAPTSPALSNLYLKEFDEEIGRYCKERGIAYTRYSDDLTFSMRSFDSHLVNFVKEKLEILGLELNRKKSKIIGGPLQKRVTGIVVNEKLQAPIKMRREIRQEMYYISKYGLDNHLEHKYNYYDKNAFINHLLGKINFVLQIDKNDNEFKRYREALLTPSLCDLRSQLKDLLK